MIALEAYYGFLQWGTIGFYNGQHLGLPHQSQLELFRPV